MGAFIGQECAAKEYPRLLIVAHLSRITAKTGNETGLGDGSRVFEHDRRIAAFGTIDEASSALDVVLTYDLSVELSTILRAVRNDLLDAGADPCVPGQGQGRLESRSEGETASGAYTRLRSAGWGLLRVPESALAPSMLDRWAPKATVFLRGPSSPDG